MMTRGRQKNTILQLKSCSVPKIVIDQLLNKLAEIEKACELLQPRSCTHIVVHLGLCILCSQKSLWLDCCCWIPIIPLCRLWGRFVLNCCWLPLDRLLCSWAVAKPAYCCCDGSCCCSNWHSNMGASCWFISFGKTSNWFDCAKPADPCGILSEQFLKGPTHLCCSSVDHLSNIYMKRQVAIKFITLQMSWSQLICKTEKLPPQVVC